MLNYTLYTCPADPPVSAPPPGLGAHVVGSLHGETEGASDTSDEDKVIVGDDLRFRVTILMMVFSCVDGLLLWLRKSIGVLWRRLLCLPATVSMFCFWLTRANGPLGHLGVHKTYNLVLKQFFWPGLKSDVTAHCRTCHVCQLAGKPNQVIPPAPLHPIPAVREPFEHVIVDCVGPLPRTKSGNQYLLTIMCATTRFPEAVPLSNITARSVVRALTKLFSTFGMPRFVQTDQGTNFKSTLFAQVLRTLNIKHVVSSTILSRRVR